MNALCSNLHYQYMFFAPLLFLYHIYFQHCIALSSDKESIIILPDSL